MGNSVYVPKTNRRAVEPWPEIIKKVRMICRLRDVNCLTFAKIAREVDSNPGEASKLYKRWHIWCAERRMAGPPSLTSLTPPPLSADPTPPPLHTYHGNYKRMPGE